MRKLTVALTASLSAEWSFTHDGDFERAGAAAMSVLKTRPMADVDDLQALIDAIDGAFEARPAGGDQSFGFISAEEPALA